MCAYIDSSSVIDLAAALSTGLGVSSNINAANVAVVLKVGGGGDGTRSSSGCGSGTGRGSSNPFGGISKSGSSLSGMVMSVSGMNAVGLV